MGDFMVFTEHTYLGYFDVFEAYSPALRLLYVPACASLPALVSIAPAFEDSCWVECEVRVVLCGRAAFHDLVGFADSEAWVGSQ